MFTPVEGSVSFPKLEEQVGAFWKSAGIYHKSLAKREGAEPFVFFEGPPTANGMPHPGHCLTRAIKDLFPRYKTMRGYRCERKAGWDTHGLPVEVEVCKQLGIHSKEEIEAYGVEPFIQLCQKSVWRYMQEWERMTERLGFWVDLEKAYVTYHQSYVESVWWSLKNLFDRGLLYQGHKIVWWWAQGGTALSSGEVGQGYREVADPSVFVKMPIVIDEKAKKLGLSDGVSLLVWTTTPWTLPSNHFAAVGRDTAYCVVENDETSERLIVAVDLVEQLAAKSKSDLKQVGEAFSGSSLVGLRYVPPFDCFYSQRGEKTVEVCETHVRNLFSTFFGDLKKRDEEKDTKVKQYLEDHPTRHIGWHVVDADFVTTDSGTGIVHIAPAFGEDDYGVRQRESQWFTDPDAVPLINCVGPDGKFTDEAPEFVRGRWVKDCDKDIIRDLKERGLLFHQEQYLHDYPFCWRAEDDPLIQYPRESWFIKTTQFKDAMLENNQQINWLPEHIKDGRMGKFLESNVDWALSRERYWGTPLPIWQCEQTGQQQAIGGYDELLAKPGVAGTEVWDKAKAANPELPDDLRVHKPYIDEVTYDSPFADGARMRRVTEVIDCWYDSGAMPFAQWGYKGEQPGAESPLPGPPREGEGAKDAVAARFHEQFPADFISEALDQTRGWFYSQLAISTMLFGKNDNNDIPQSEIPNPQSPPHPFKNCIVLGLMLSEWYEDKKDSKKLFLNEEEAKAACGNKGYKHAVGKMSKSKRNYREPNEIFDRYGADALRWYLFANQPPWTSIRYSEQSIKDSIPEFLLRLWNCYSFMVIYANIDEWDPGQEVGAPLPDPPREGEGAIGLEAHFAQAKSYRPVFDRDQIDRWIISELHRTIALVTERMDAYDNFGACGAINEFVDALSNWYVRRSRDRFWAKDKRAVDKLDAYWTLYECLVSTTKMIAPFVPFLADAMWRNLTGVFDGALESVHLCDYPEAHPALVDEQLSERMALVRLISSLGRRAREVENLKVRQPLSKVEVILAKNTHQAWLEENASVIADEINVKAVEFSDEPDKYVEHEVLPNYRLLGKKFGKLLPKVKEALNLESATELLENFRDNGLVNITVEGEQLELLPEEVQVRITAKEGYAAANDKGAVVVLATELTPELIAEGTARDLVRVIQDTRKETGCEFTDRIEVGIESDDPTVVAAVEQFGDYIAGETLAVSAALGPIAGVEPVELTIGNAVVKVYVRVK
ncbi:class I tRNA ligase family protein [Aeoliella mucimassa]|uniref:Isoleucine--tRNA ligase n=1 Tax=Aeoliella mucimassa TaxID=2527972 RepID=A0A518AJQ8_9BACT|nr:class I tRNA ligase family protein [Aeoliella mucimassa]QDU54914.1 Isoleucine--tRNA ligase [Aeoliella mucimassa]